MNIEALGLRDKRVTVLGLGREGKALARFLAAHGARVLLTDTQTREALQPSLDQLAGLPIEYALGGNPPEALDTEVLFVSPGVPLDTPFMLAARQAGVALGSETRLFSWLCPAPIVAISGSSGKTTTTTLTGLMLAQEGKRAVHVGGNIGDPLLGRLDRIGPADVVVMELSSFQLDFLGASLQTEPSGAATNPLYPAGAWSPGIAALLNVTPNHLDRHGTMDAYVFTKSKILRYQTEQGHAVLNWDDPMTRGMAGLCPGSVAYFSLVEPVPRGAWLNGDRLVLRENGVERAICSAGELKLRGRHNIANVLAACAIAATAGATPAAMAAVAITFTGVEHRLELAGEHQGVRYYNDSIATSPERAMAAIRSFDEPIVLLAGGKDKHLPWDDWAALVAQKVRQVIVFGQAAGLIRETLAALGPASPPVQSAQSVEEAVALAAAVARPGDVVLFSPGGTSYDAFKDFTVRGRLFKQVVQGLHA